jgi:hypothetical protein
MVQGKESMVEAAVVVDALRGDDSLLRISGHGARLYPWQRPDIYSLRFSIPPRTDHHPHVDVSHLLFPWERMFLDNTQMQKITQAQT